MTLRRRIAVACATAALLTTAACGGGDDDTDPFADPGGERTEGETEGDAGNDEGGTDGEATGDEPPDGVEPFDECALLDPAELAALIGVETLYITAREVLPEAPEGGRLAGCSYLNDDVPGITGMTLNTVTGTDRESFFRPFAEREVHAVDTLGDRAEVAAYEIPDSGLHFRELRVAAGDIGLHLRYTYNESPGGMPALDEDAVAQLMSFVANAGLERLPDEVYIPDGTPEGPCADVDLAQAADTLGAELTTARAVVGGDGALSCSFTGDQAGLEVVVITDDSRAPLMRAPAEVVNAPDIGDGARLLIQPNDETQGPLDATVNVGENVVLVIASYDSAAGRVTEPRPADVDLVRAVAGAVSP